MEYNPKRFGCVCLAIPFELEVSRKSLVLLVYLGFERKKQLE